MRISEWVIIINRSVNLLSSIVRRLCQKVCGMETKNVSCNYTARKICLLSCSHMENILSRLLCKTLSFALICTESWTREVTFFSFTYSTKILFMAISLRWQVSNFFIYEGYDLSCNQGFGDHMAVNGVNLHVSHFLYNVASWIHSAVSLYSTHICCLLHTVK